MRQYNSLSDTVQFDPMHKFIGRDTLIFPLIAPGTEQIFPLQLHDLLQQPKWESFCTFETPLPMHVLLVSPADDGHHFLAYYVSGQLRLATAVSLGK